jgi:hypothetical protein
MAEGGGIPLGQWSGSDATKELEETIKRRSVGEREAAGDDAQLDEGRHSYGVCHPCLDADSSAASPLVLHSGISVRAR